MSQLKIIVIKKAECLSPSFLTQIAKNVDRIASTNCLFLSGSQLPPKKEEEIARIGKVILFQKPTFQQIRAWVKKKCKEEAKDIDSAAISLLIENTGGKLSILAQELKKIVTYVGSRERIELKDVLTVGTNSRTYTVFQLVDAICEKKTQNGLKILKSLLVSRVSPQQIIGLLNWQFARIWKVKSRIYSGIPPYRALREAGIPSFSARSFLQKVNKLSWEELGKCFNLLLNADFQIKRGREEDLTLELLLLRIT